MLVGRLEELKAQRGALEQRRAEIETELRHCSDEPVPYEAVKEALRQFSRLLASASGEQRKTLLQLFVKEIILTRDRKVDRIEMRFDENTEAHLAEEACTTAQSLAAGRRLYSVRGDRWQGKGWRTIEPSAREKQRSSSALFDTRNGRPAERGAAKLQDPKAMGLKEATLPMLAGPPKENDHGS